MRNILADNGITVACGACFVEDRRQLLGEIADTYINMWKEAVETGNPLQKTNAQGQKVTLTVTKDLAKKYGVTKGTNIVAEDKYIPTQYDLTTYEGFRLLEKNHPTIAMGFNRYNNSRGQQSGRLIEGRAEYKRQILGWSNAQVKRVNNNGGLRIFSFSDFEVVHLLDLVQIIIDCSAKGVKIQGYTKNPTFARLIRNTGIKLNRSLIPKGEYGIKVVNGKRVLDIDTVEGIDINDKDFLDEQNNNNVGNIIIGINQEQIGIAMLDSTIDYIIPFHSNKAKSILKALGLETWANYKESQHEKDIDTGKASKHNVNIYTQVINKYNPKNKVEFVNAFLEECKNQGKIPRYSEFLNIDENGNYTYREGYHKLLVDFKMFDAEGNILLQENVVPNLDEQLMTDILNKEIQTKLSYEFPKGVYEQIEQEFGTNENDTRYSKSVDLSLDEELIERINNSNKSAITVMRDYIFEKLGGRDIELSDGITAMIDKTDARHIGQSSKSFSEKAQVSQIEKIIKFAKFYDEVDVEHDKFSQFRYYELPVKYDNNVSFVTLNVGKGKTDSKYHIYDLTEPKERNTPNRINGFVRSVDDALRKGVSTNKLPQTEQNVNPQTETRKSLTVDSQGNTLTEAQQEYFKDSKVRDDKGNLMVVYHGSPAKFTIFKHSKMNIHGNSHGRGFYFTEDENLASGYEKEGGQLLKGYLNISNPMSEDKVTIKKSSLVKIIKAICESEANYLVNNEGYENIEEALKDTFVSNYVYTYDMTMNNAYNEVADIIYAAAENDVDIVAELTNASGDTQRVLENVVEITGLDGVIYTNETFGTHEYIALLSNQFKNSTNENPTENEDIRYSKNVDLTTLPDSELQDAVENEDITRDQAEQELMRRYGKIPNSFKPKQNIVYTPDDLKDGYATGL